MTCSFVYSSESLVVRTCCFWDIEHQCLWRLNSDPQPIPARSSRGFLEHEDGNRRFQKRGAYPPPVARRRVLEIPGIGLPSRYRCRPDELVELLDDLVLDVDGPRHLGDIQRQEQ